MFNIYLFVSENQNLLKRAVRQAFSISEEFYMIYFSWSLFSYH